LTGFSRMWRHWGVVFAILAYIANLWPAWVTSSGTLFSYIFGGDASIIAIVLLVLVGAILTLAPIVYNALERAQMLKVAAVALLVVVGAVFAIGGAWADVPTIVTEEQFPAAELGFRSEEHTSELQSRENL